MASRIGRVRGQLNACAASETAAQRPHSLAARQRVSQARGVRCFACGLATQLASSERVGFRDTCTSCDADLHVCRNCRHHDVSAYNECRESSAERVGARDRANRCDYFVPGGEKGAEEGAAQASDALENLFRKP